MHEDETAVLRRELPGRYAALSEDERRHGGPAVDELLAATARLLHLDRAAGTAVRGGRTVVGAGAVIAVGALALMPVIGGIALLAVDVVAGVVLAVAAWSAAGLPPPSRSAGVRAGSRPAAHRPLLALVVLGLAALLVLLVAVGATGVAVVAAVAVVLATAVTVVAPRWWP